MRGIWSVVVTTGALPARRTSLMVLLTADFRFVPAEGPSLGFPTVGEGGEFAGREKY